MKILLTGGTGFIGSALSQQLTTQGHRLVILSRQAKTDTQAVKFIQNFANLSNLNDIDAIINLAGEPIFDKAWTNSQKAELRRSRLEITAKLVELCLNSDNPPHTFLSGSATGYYGNMPDFAKNCDETTACGAGFTAELCYEWEQTALRAQSEKTRVCLLRTGIVLDKQGGALKRMLPLYRFGLGGKLGRGQQHWAWISLRDQLRAIQFLLENPQAQGAFNLVAPTPLRNETFNRQLADTLNRPAFFHAPQFALKMLLGERAKLLLDNQPLAPQKLLMAGFRFANPTFELLLKNNPL